MFRFKTNPNNERNVNQAASNKIGSVVSDVKNSETISQTATIPGENINHPL